MILGYKYAYSPLTHIIRSARFGMWDGYMITLTRCLGSEDEKGKEVEDEFHSGLNIFHLMCIFDQQHMLEWVALQSKISMTWLDVAR